MTISGSWMEDQAMFIKIGKNFQNIKKFRFSNRRLQNSSECKHQLLFNVNLTSYEEFHVVIFNGGTWVSLHDVDRLWSGLCSWYYWWWFLLGPRLDNCGLLPPRRWRWCHRPAMGTEFLLSLLLGLSCRRVWLRLFQHHITLLGFIWNNKYLKEV